MTIPSEEVLPPNRYCQTIFLTFFCFLVENVSNKLLGNVSKIFTLTLHWVVGPLKMVYIQLNFRNVKL